MERAGMSLNKISRLFLGIVCTQMLLGTASAESFKLQFIGAGVAAINARGVVLGADYDSNSSTDSPFLYEHHTKTPISALKYTPKDINSNGDVVGASTVSIGENSYLHYFFLTKKDQETVQIASVSNASYSTPNMTLNDTGRIAFAVGDTLYFYQESSLVGTVTAPNVLFESYGELLILTNGDVLAEILLSGTPRFARFTSSGSMTLIDPDAIPFGSELKRLSSDGKVLFLDGDDLKITDLSSPAEYVPLPSGIKGDLNIIDLNTRGQTLLLNKKKLKSSDDDEYLFAENGSTPVNLNCMLPNKSIRKVSSAFALSDSGSILVDLANKKRYADAQGLLEPTGDTRAQNYCTKVTVKVVGACKKYFSGLKQISSVPGNKSCTAEVTVKDSRGKPVVGVDVVTESYDTIKRGTTNSSGKLTFAFKTIGSHYYMEVVAPYNSKKWIGHSEEFSFLETDY